MHERHASHHAWGLLCMSAMHPSVPGGCCAQGPCIPSCLGAAVHERHASPACLGAAGHKHNASWHAWGLLRSSTMHPCVSTMHPCMPGGLLYTSTKHPGHAWGLLCSSAMHPSMPGCCCAQAPCIPARAPCIPACLGAAVHKHYGPRLDGGHDGGHVSRNPQGATRRGPARPSTWQSRWRQQPL